MYSKTFLVAAALLVLAQAAPELTRGGSQLGRGGSQLVRGGSKPDRRVSTPDLRLPSLAQPKPKRFDQNVVGGLQKMVEDPKVGIEIDLKGAGNRLMGLLMKVFAIVRPQLSDILKDGEYKMKEFIDEKLHAALEGKTTREIPRFEVLKPFVIGIINSSGVSEEYVHETESVLNLIAYAFMAKVTKPGELEK